jgi:hypothetical protein
MAKANRKAIDSSNFWDGHWVHGMYTAKPKINAGETKTRHEKKKIRLRAERHMHNIYIRYSKYKRKQSNKMQKAHDQIKYGFDLAQWWNEQHE